MTKGNITKILFQFAAPLVASSLLQQLYNIADSMIAGNFIGENAVAAIGVSTSIVMFFTNVIIGFTTGVSIYIAQLTGRRDNEKIGEAIRTSFFYLVPAALLMAVLSLGIIEQVLTMMHTDGSIFAMTKTYISIIFAGIPFVMVYNICSAILRGMGNSKTSMQAIVIATFTNIFVDILFVAVFQWGIMGAALATVLSQLFSCIYVLAYLLLRVVKKFPCRHSFTKEALKEQTRLGLPCVLQSGIMSFGSIILQGIMNTLGVQAVTAITSAYRLDSLAMLPAVSMASAVSTFTAQNMGARQYDRVSEGYSISVKMMLLLSVTIAAAVILGRKIIYPPVRSKRRGCRAGTEFPVYALRVLSHIRDAESVYWVPTGHRQRDYSRCLQHNRPGSSPYAGSNSCRTARLSIRPLQRGNLLDCGRLSVL